MGGRKPDVEGYLKTDEVATLLGIANGGSVSKLLEKKIVPLRYGLSTSAKPAALYWPKAEIEKHKAYFLELVQVRRERVQPKQHVVQQELSLSPANEEAALKILMEFEAKLAKIDDELKGIQANLRGLHAKIREEKEDVERQFGDALEKVGKDYAALALGLKILTEGGSLPKKEGA